MESTRSYLEICVDRSTCFLFGSCPIILESPGIIISCACFQTISETMLTNSLEAKHHLASFWKISMVDLVALREKDFRCPLSPLRFVSWNSGAPGKTGSETPGSYRHLGHSKAGRSSQYRKNRFPCGVNRWKHEKGCHGPQLNLVKTCWGPPSHGPQPMISALTDLVSWSARNAPSRSLQRLRPRVDQFTVCGAKAAREKTRWCSPSCVRSHDALKWSCTCNWSLNLKRIHYE